MSPPPRLFLFVPVPALRPDAVANTPRRAFEPLVAGIDGVLVVVVVVVRGVVVVFDLGVVPAAEQLRQVRFFAAAASVSESRFEPFFCFLTVSVGTAGFFVSSTSSLASESSLASLALAMYAAKSSSLSLSSVSLRANAFCVRGRRRPRTA